MTIVGMNDLQRSRIWIDAFHWKQLFRLDIFFFLVAGFPALGGILLFFDQYTLAAICFGFTGLLIIGRILYFAYDHKDSPRNRTIFVVVGAVVVGGLTFWSVWGTLAYARNKAGAINYPPPPQTPSSISITWPDPAPIIVGTSLSSTQLNAKPNVEASPSYNPDIGNILPVGVHALTVTFTPKDTAKYAIASKTVTLVVNQKTDNPTGMH